MHTPKLEEWISVSQQDLKEVESSKQRGITLQFMISPADMPTAFRVIQLKDSEFVVEFKYLAGSEAKTLESREDGVLLEIGRNSKRIYKIYLDVSKFSPSKELLIKHAKDVIGHSRGDRKSVV